jgi:MoaA/NifB/PqqE/SkfB family radical SAM enzyme
MNTSKNIVDLVNYHYFFDIELSSVCNLHCNICPREKIVRAEHFLSEKNVDILVKWLPCRCNIMFSGMGEPLMHPHCIDVINQLASNGRIIGITTNGQLLNDDKIERLVNSKINFLQISLNQLDNDKYKKITNAENSKLLDNIKKVVSQKPDKLEIQLSFIDEEMPLEEKNKIKMYCDNFGVRCFIKSMHNRGGYLDYSRPKSNIIKYACCLFAQFTFISCDGNILSCCHDIESKNIIGNIKTDSFEDVITKKISIIKNNKWFNQCPLCNDDGRNKIIKL